MNNTGLLSKLDTEEGKKKAESLFSIKFREYLSSKKSCSAVPDKASVRNYPFPKDVSESSDETTTSESSRKSGKRGKKKSKDKHRWDFQYGFRNKLTQCSLIKNKEEVAVPEELRPLLVNMTIILQEFKQSRSEFDELYSLISRITVLVTEFIRRPLKKLEDNNKGNYMKNLEKTAERMMSLLDDYKTGPMLEPDNGIREYKRMVKNLIAKNLEIADLKKRISETELKLDLKTKDTTEKVKNSILANEKLKYEIRFNNGQIKRYKKILIEKEWAKHKTESELSHLKRKSSKLDFFDEGIDKLLSVQDSVSEKKWLPKKTLTSSRRVKGKKVQEKPDKTK